MFCASVSHATSPRNIHATTREVTSTAWLKIPRDKCLGFDASKTCPIDLRILRRVLKSDSSSLSVNNVPWGRRKGAARLRLWQKGETFQLKAVYGKHASYFIQGLEFRRGSVVISRAFGLTDHLNKYD